MTRRRLIAAIVTAAACAVGGGVAVARFTSAPTTATATVTVIVPTIPRPASVTCTNGPLLAVADFTWSDPAVVPYVDPTEYVLRIRRANGTILEATRVPGAGANSASLTPNLLSQLLSGILSLIVGGEVITVTVNSVYGNYESASSWTYRLTATLIPVGVGCAPYTGPVITGLAVAPEITTTTASTSPSTTSPSSPTSTLAPPTTVASTSTSGPVPTTLAATTTIAPTSTTDIAVTTAPPVTTTTPATTIPATTGPP